MPEFKLDTQIAAQAASIHRLLTQHDLPRLDAERPLILAGIGTSWHACRVAAYWLIALSHGQIRPLVYNSHDLALNAPLSKQDQVIVVSHRGSKTFPRQVLQRARQIGATTIAITSSDAPAQDADYHLHTCPGEISSTHTISYTSALTVLAQLVAGCIGKQASQPFLDALQEIPTALDAILEHPAPVQIAEQLANREPILLAGVGIDAITAAEAALKIKEGTYQWAEGFETENALHGPPAAFRTGLGAITITPARDDGGRTASLRTQLHALGAVAFSCGSDNEDLWFPAVHPLLRPLVAIVPLQRLVAEIARIKGSNPDAIHTDQEPWTSAMANVTL
ncbi:SIS domain-containing protein [Dictyobacter arantiisoli]|uniref:Glutamine--fructose-6-phosphate aminotransferase [isomerizing] n=1 Tax=Dictyobacter arantiisoli TaxID=2014874 RepID=A0A5A5TFP4_9CHLR|nr:SIS domain-containing protein [Dictyobacter arantiisoli]GCF09734.1 hypothetical protein KDI_32980 [Dictyobacter arantiisoli]